MSWIFLFFTPLFKLLFGIRIYGRQNIPEGGAILCPNHRSALDPILVGIAVGKKNYPWSMAKAELFKNPLAAKFLTAMQAYPVKRGSGDISAIKASLWLLSSGNKLLIFPEGTRLSCESIGPMKSGAVRIAAQTGKPIVPIWIKKTRFGRRSVYIGEPVNVPKMKESEAREWMDKNLVPAFDKLSKRP